MNTRARSENPKSGEGNDRGAVGQASSLDPMLRAISAKEFALFQEVIYREAGIWLSSMKVSLLAGRLARRLRQHGLHSYREYYKLVVESPEERVHMLDAITTNETHFFREPQHFEYLKSTVFPKWTKEAAAGLRSRRIRVWSAGCSTGQEAYSLAMILLHCFSPCEGWQIEIIATDISTRVLEAAKKGIWPSERSAEIPHEYLKAFMLKGLRGQAGKIKAGREISSVIQFSRVNLNDDTYPFAGNFDLIFCRNVLIYFDKHSRERAVRRLTAMLAPDGCFFVGHAESLHTMTDTVRSMIPTVYTLTAKAKQTRHAGQ